ncbi:MAG: substrate-binding domain-containing protein [Lachnospiraceae bacterium]|nr:substrate-binding domain-containing protein [Lachnospiraceae bacterium]
MKNIFKKTAKLISVFLTMVMILLPLSSCSVKEGEMGDNTENVPDTVNIGMSFDSFVIERWQRDRDVFVSTAKEMGAEVNVQNANGNIEEQKRQILYFIEQNVDVIVIICIDADTLSEEVKKAKNAGIKVIAYDRIIRDADIDLYISFDNATVGTIMGETLIQSGITEGSNVVMIGGSPADYNVPALEDGFIEVMEGNKVNIVDRTHCEAWRAEIAYDYVYENMETISNADAIMCGNDNIASKVVSALSEQRLAGRIPVTGQDADLEACQRIVEGTQLMTVYKPVDNLAKRAAECAIKLANHEVLGTDQTMNNGTYDVPCILLEPIAVTKDNMDEVIINSGFHTREDVYLNVTD